MPCQGLRRREMIVAPRRRGVMIVRNTAVGRRGLAACSCFPQDPIYSALSEIHLGLRWVWLGGFAIASKFPPTEKKPN